MNLLQLINVNNNCYKVHRKLVPKGIMVHSTASRGVPAATWAYKWNVPKPGGDEKCVHAFLDDKEVWQCLPWDVQGWHAGGKASNTHLSFEIAEPPAGKWTDAATFRKYINNALDLCEYWCRMFGLTEKDVIAHYEGHKLGIASNHADVSHWFPKCGYSMDKFRAELKARLSVGTPPVEPEQPDEPQPPETTDYTDFVTTRDCYTLWAISKRFGVSTSAILLPDGKKPNSLAMKIGMTVRVWYQRPAEASYYTWAAADTTVYALAKRYGVNYKTIKMQDGSTPPYDNMHVGMVLRIK